jgi:hypothetical protein
MIPWDCLLTALRLESTRGALFSSHGMNEEYPRPWRRKKKRGDLEERLDRQSSREVDLLAVRQANMWEKNHFSRETFRSHKCTASIQQTQKEIVTFLRCPLPRNSTGPSTCSLLLLFLLCATLSSSFFSFQFFSPFPSWQPFRHPQLLVQTPKPPPQPHSMWGLCFPLKSINNRPQI